VSPQLHTCSQCRRALASPCAPWHRARHPTGKSSTITTCPVTADPSSIVGGLLRRHVPRATGPATLHGRASVSPHVPRHQTRLLVWECSGVVMCPMALGLLPGREELRCHHMSCGSRPTSRCGRALASPRAPWLSASEACPCVPKASDIRLIIASPGTRSRQRIKCVQNKVYVTCD
jgi:hypothetical protein